MLFDRKGNPITVLQWAELQADPEYRVLRQDIIMGSDKLSTIWVGIPSVEHVLGWGQYIFETMRFQIGDDSFKVLEFPDPETGEMLTQIRYATEEEAYQGHLAILKKIRETEMT